MCDPLTAAALAASAGGALISGNEANSNAKRTQEARNAATLAEVERQKAYGAEARGSFDHSLGLFGPGAPEASLTKAQGDIGSLFHAQVPTAMDVGTITTSGAPKVVGASEGDRLAGVFQRLGQNATNFGNLKGYDQNVFNNNLEIGQGNRDIDRVAGNSKTSGAVNRIEQDAAATNAYKPPSGFGELLSLGGSLGAMASGAGKLGIPKFGGSTTLPTALSNPTQIGTLF